MTATIVPHVERGNHVGSVFGGVIHGVATEKTFIQGKLAQGLYIPSALFASVAFHEGSIDGVC